MEPPASPPCQAENGPMAASSPAVPQNLGLEGCHGWERGVGLRDGGDGDRQAATWPCRAPTAHAGTAL